jgi:hypothetical protein
MMHSEFVYARYDFLPRADDELQLYTGEAIDILEKDEVYNDGWWKVGDPSSQGALQVADNEFSTPRQGRNRAGDVGIFPKSYVSSERPQLRSSGLPWRQASSREGDQ